MIIIVQAAVHRRNPGQGTCRARGKGSGTQFGDLEVRDSQESAVRQETGAGRPGKGVVRNRAGLLRPKPEDPDWEATGGMGFSQVGAATAVRFGGGAYRNLGPSWQGRRFGNPGPGLQDPHLAGFQGSGDIRPRSAHDLTLSSFRSSRH